MATCPDTQLAEDIARVYNTQKDSCCRLVQWSGYSLRALQLAAICLGGKALASLCLAMSINFKQFSSGAPDLFLVRVRAKFISQQQTEQYVTIPLEYLLGYEWNKRRGKGSNSAWDDGDDLLTPTATSAKSKSNNKRGRNWQRNAIEEDVQQPVAVEEETEYELLRSTKKHRNTNGSRTANGTADMSAEEIQDDSTLNAEEIEAAVIQIAAEESLVMPDYETILRIQRLQQSQENSHGTEEDDLDRMYGSSLVFGESSSKNEEKDVNIPEIEFVFESMSVEVKGPTDHLAYKQLFWLKLLSLPFFDRHKAFVCHVKETE